MEKFQNLASLKNVEVICDDKQTNLKGGNGFTEGCPPDYGMTDSPKG